MRSRALSISAVVCTLDESRNIARCLRSLDGQGIDQVILVDGGSVDSTIEDALAVRPDIEILQLPGQGLLRQRAAGIDVAAGELLLILDADDELLPGSVAASIEHMASRGLDGVQFGYAADLRTRWSSWWSVMLDVSTPCGVSLPMLGRPALMWRGLFPPSISSLDLPLRHEAEDAFLHETLIATQPPRRFEGGPGATLRRQPTSLGEILRKSWNYGRGDARQVLAFGRPATTLFHLAWRYPVIRGSRAIRRRSPGAALVCVIVGFVRLFSMSRVLLLRSVRRR